ncbi:hypothetical protein CDN99_18205 [Roseateles aquatilis]|uniref:SnoaL-like domain-containing protein n=2 Tax=Roseateles aquatilis TaxID=431061 RepID=A0A246J4M7_9BURK|nr:hypothetical protein CDN99_18205 [Roseateles aquatilis]
MPRPTDMTPHQLQTLCPEVSDDEANVLSRLLGHLHRAAYDELLGMFSQDAHVNDQLRNFWGLDRIRAWLEEEISDQHLQVSISSIRKHHDHVILSARMRGDFATGGLSDSVLVDLHVKIGGSKIVRLLILLVLTDDAPPEVRVQVRL